jgi:hypothetical protein
MVGALYFKGPYYSKARGTCGPPTILRGAHTPCLRIIESTNRTSTIVPTVHAGGMGGLIVGPPTIAP